MNWPLLAGSLAAVLALAGLAWALGLGGGMLADSDEARRIAEAAVPGFVAGAAYVGIDRRAAIVLGADGGVAALRLHGAQFVARALAAPLAIEQQGPTVTIASGERLLGPFVITLANEAEARELTRVLGSLAPRA